MKEKILVVDDDKFMVKAITKLIDRHLGLEVLSAYSFYELKSLDHFKNIALAISDYHLPDAEKGEAIDYLISKGVPVIVLTATYDTSTRKKILQKDIVDYLPKSIPQIAEHIVEVIKRTLKSMNTKVLVVEDNLTDLKTMIHYLKIMCFQTRETTTGAETLKILFKEPDIKLLLLDYYLPDKDAFELITQIRQRFKKDQLSIIIVSGTAPTELIPLLLKAGANDFLAKPFSKEEFMARIFNNLEILALIEELKETSLTDPLTKLRNRRYFFQEAPKIFNIAKRLNQPLACVIIDIDKFKKVNDTYGHEAGDQILISIADILKNFFRRRHDIIVRWGGEEFLILTFYRDKTLFIQHLEKLRKTVEETEFYVFINEKKEKIKVTISIGAELSLKESLDEMVRSADQKLYKAKNLGRNKLIV